MTIVSASGPISEVEVGWAGFYVEINGMWYGVPQTDPLFDARLQLMLTAWVNQAAVVISADTGDPGNTAPPTIINGTYAVLS